MTSGGSTISSPGWDGRRSRPSWTDIATSSRSPTRSTSPRTHSPMASDRSIRRYRRWYARLLRLYPRPFRQRFAEPMEQTFSDLARERREANQGLIGFAIGAFADTSAQIMRENMTQLMETNNVIRWGRWVLVTAALLAVPALAM